MQTALIIIHVIISLLLIVVVLMQHGKQQGLSGAIAGGAETFFGKNKGRTIDAVLKKITVVFAILFIVSSIVLTAYSINTSKKNVIDDGAAQSTVESTDGSEAPLQATMDEEGNLVDENGNILITAEDLAAQKESMEEGTEATPAE